MNTINTRQSAIDGQKKGCVLIVDDLPENIHLLDNILKEKYDIQVAINGVKALEIVSGNNPPDVILLDIVMPGTDGYEVCRRLKADERTCDIPVIFVTARDSVDDEEYGFNLGAVDYITKPFQAAVVQVRVKSQMEQQQNKKIIRQHLKDKEILLREVHHRIKNNIASIWSLLRMQARSTVNPEAQAVLREAISRVQSMGVLYDKLLNTKGYRDIPVKDYFEDLIASIIVCFFTDNAAITLNKEIADFNLDTKKLYPLGLIVNELLTNCIKNGFRGKDSGTIDLALTKREQEIVLTVRDDGNGLPENFDMNKAAGLGLMLVQGLTQELSGTFTISSDHGVKSVVTFDI